MKDNLPLLERALVKVGLIRPRKVIQVVKRGYESGAQTRLTADWNPVTLTGDSDIRDGLKTLIARARDMEHSNCYFSRFLNALENNVLGCDGVAFQAKIVEPETEDPNSFKVPDDYANRAVEGSFKEWGKAEFCSVNEEDSWIDFQKLTLRSCARDGAILIRLVRDASINKFGFAVQLIEADYIDQNYSFNLGNGNTIRFGIEKNKWGKTVAYWLLGQHPGDTFYYGGNGSAYYRTRVDAKDYIYYFVKKRTTQTVGAPWASASMMRMHHLDRYEQSEEMAARRGAEKGGFFKSDRGTQFAGDTEAPINSGSGESVTEATQNTLNDFEPQSYDELPAGMDFVPYAPDHPVSAFPDFVRSCLYGIAAGLNTDYSTLTGDLSQANYSSMRSGKLETWEAWKSIQTHLITKVFVKIYEAWLEMALLSGQLKLSLSKIEKYKSVVFTGRRWPWVDPLKDIQAASMAVNGGFGTKTDYLKNNGVGDYEDTMEQLAYEKDYEEKKGLKFVTGEKAQPEESNPPQNGNGANGKNRVVS